jgi:hypothetical protein
MTDAESLPGLSRDQTMILLGQALSPGVPVYSTPVIFHLDGAIDPERFQGAFRTALARAPILGQRFRFPTGLLDEAGSETDADIVVTSEWVAKRPIVDPARRSWYSALEGGRSQRRWLVDFHQIVADQWSVRHFFDEVSALYQNPDAPARISGATLEQLRDDPGDAARDRVYWRRWLEQEFTPGQVVPMTGAAPSRTYSFDVTGERYAQLLDITAAYRELPTTSLAHLVSWLAVLAHWHRLAQPAREWLSIGVSWHNRTVSTRHMIGPFMRVTPVQIPLAGSWEDALKRIERGLMLGLAHRHHTVANPPHRPVYDCMVTLGAEPWPPSFAGVPVRVEFGPSGYISGRLDIQLCPRDNGYGVTISQRQDDAEFDDQLLTESLLALGIGHERR